MYKYIRNSKKQISDIYIDVNFYSILSYIKDIFASNEINALEDIIYNHMISEFDDIIELTRQMLHSTGCIIDDEKESTYNKTDQVSYYICFHHQDVEIDNTIAIEIRMKITNHSFNLRDKQGNYILDENGNLLPNIRRVKLQQRKSDTDIKFDLEQKIHRIISLVKPENIVINGTTTADYYDAAYEIKDVIEEYLDRK